MIQTHLDYLQGTFYINSLPAFEKILKSLVQVHETPDAWYWTEREVFLGEQFNIGFGSTLGIYGGLRQINSYYRGIIQLPGNFLRELDLDKQIEVVKILDEDLKLKFTRCDIAMDDYDRRISFDFVKHLGEEGLYRYVDCYQLIEEKLDRDSEPVPTCYFGSESSPKRLRFYNAEVMHGFPADRWELQLRQDHAIVAIEEFLEDPECLPRLITRSVDFILSHEVDHWRDYRRQKFWQSFINETGKPQKLQLPKYETDLEKILRWLDRQVAPSLAVLNCGLGQEKFEEEMNALIEKGFNRLNNKQFAWIDRLQRGNVSAWEDEKGLQS